MRKLIMTAALCLSALPAMAHAETKVLEASGTWTAFGGTSDNGQPVCGVSTSWGVGRTSSLFVKWYYGSPQIAVQIYKSTWHIPAGTEVAVVIRLDNAPPWSGTAVAVPQYPNMIQLNVPSEKLESFMNQIRYANNLSVSFPVGNEPTWAGNMDGSNAAATTMGQCYTSIMASKSAPSQPYVANPTQPFAPAAPAPKPTSDVVSRRNDI